MTFNKHAQTDEPDLADWIWPNKSSNFWKIDFGKLALGLCLVVFGLLYLAKNLGWLPLQLSFDLIDLWPLLIIFWGLSLISGRGWMAILAGGILTTTVIIIAGVLVSQQMLIKLEPELTQIPAWQDKLAQVNFMKHYPVAFETDTNIKKLYLSIDNQLGNIKLTGQSSKLISGSLQSNFSQLLINSQANSETKTVVLNSLTKASKASQSQSLLDLQINNNVATELELNNGSSLTSALLQDLRLSSLVVNSKNSDLQLTLGQKATEQNIDLNGRFQQVNLMLPKDVGITVNGLDSRLDGFKPSTKASQSANLTQATKFININFEFQPDQLSVAWY